MTDEELRAQERHPEPWQPETRPRVLALLGKLAEEATELAGIASRIIIQGLDAPHSDDGRPNRLHLEDELADVAALAGLAMSGMGWSEFVQLTTEEALAAGHQLRVVTVDTKQALDYDRVEARREAKKRFLVQWLTALSHMAPSELAAAEEQRRDALQDLAYVNGAREGFSAASAADPNAALAAIVERRREAVPALKEARQRRFPDELRPEDVVVEAHRFSLTDEAKDRILAEEAQREAVIAAYIAGAQAVHDHHDSSAEPDFTEAAHDYAASLEVVP
ncbi:hypothetical protein [Caulobacter phage Kronos]|uniref:Uncharacterized protein n=1 Tax=Caulobacter phage Kronos TaxID=2340873 RepID=A0A386KSP8_9CAUD|nr:hypothetical protein [Caulobacter phage Kronos]